MQDIKKFIIIVGIIVVGGLSLLGLWWAFFGSAAQKNLMIEPIAVEVDQARRGSIIRRITVVGKLRADNEVVIHPEIDGKISKVNFEGGTFVKKGTPLVEIDDEIYKAKLKEAEAGVIFFTAELERYTTLAEKSAAPVRKKEEALSQKLQAEAKFELAQIQLNNTIIKAPFSGLVGLKRFGVGSYIDPRSELLTLVDVDPIKVDFRVPAVYLKNISRGQSVTLKVDGFQGETFDAKIDAIDSTIDPTANSVLVRGVIPNPNGRLKPGLFARINLVVGSKEDVVIIPESAVLRSAEEEYVFGVVEHPINGVPTKIAIRASVVTGLSEGGLVEVVRGLREGIEIITIGLSKVRDQYPVKVVEDVEAEAAFKEIEKENKEITGGTGQKEPAAKGEEKPAEEPATQEEPAAKDEEKPAEEPAIQEEPAAKDEEKTAAEPAPQEEPAAEGEEKPAEKPATQEEPATKDEEKPAAEPAPQEEPAENSKVEEKKSTQVSQEEQSNDHSSKKDGE